MLGGPASASGLVRQEMRYLIVFHAVHHSLQTPFGCILFRDRSELYQEDANFRKVLMLSTRTFGLASPDRRP